MADASPSQPPPASPSVIHVPASPEFAEQRNMSTGKKVALAAGSGLLIAGAAVGAAALLAGGAIVGYGIYRYLKSKGETLERGDSVELPLSTNLRVLLSWVPSKHVKSDEADLDLSTVAYGADGEKKGMCFFDNRRDMYGAIQLSEDVKSDEGLDEAVSVNLVQLDDMDVEYLAINVSSFKGVTFDKFKHAEVKMFDNDGTLIFRFPLDHIGAHNAACLGRFIRKAKGEWVFQAFGIPLDGTTPDQLLRFSHWLTAKEFVPYPSTMYVYLKSGRELTARDSNGKSDPWAEMGLVEVKEEKQERYRPVQIRGIKRGLETELAAFLNAQMSERGWSVDPKDLIDPANIKFASNTYVVPLRTRLMAERMLLLTGSRFAPSDDDRLDIFLVEFEEDDFVASSDTKKTSVKKKTLNPKWDEVLEVTVPMRFFLDDYIAYVHVEVKDQDGFISHKHQDMGFCRIPFFDSFVQAYQNRKSDKKDYASEWTEYQMNKGSGFLRMRVGFARPEDDCGFRVK